MASSPVRRAKRSTGQPAGQSPNGLPTKRPGRERCRTAARAKSAKSSTANYAGSRAKQRAPCAAIRSPRAAHPTAAASALATASPARKRPTGRWYIRASRRCSTSNRLTFGNGQSKSPRSTLKAMRAVHVPRGDQPDGDPTRSN